jgi:hypothetical protein
LHERQNDVISSQFRANPAEVMMALDFQGLLMDPEGESGSPQTMGGTGYATGGSPPLFRTMQKP